MAKPLGPTGEFCRMRDEWQKHSMLSKQLLHATPNLGIALIIFGIYLIGEITYNKIYAPHSHSHSSSSSSASQLIPHLPGECTGEMKIPLAHCLGGFQ